MGRTVVSIVSGVVVGVLTAVFFWFFMMAATWSSIHGGMSQLTLAVLSLVALVAPPGCGFLVGWAIYRSESAPQVVRADGQTDSIRLICPHCGCSMTASARYADTPPYTVVECPIHGPFHFGPTIALTLGRPPRS